LLRRTCSTSATSASELTSLGLLEPLDRFVEADAASAKPGALKLDDLYPQVVDAFRYDGSNAGRGTLWGIPKDFTTVGFYWNKDLFRKAGLAPPKPGWKNVGRLHRGRTHDRGDDRRRRRALRRHRVRDVARDGARVPLHRGLRRGGNIRSTP
jgi:hypothetical protein